jgi:hypothetical protein
MDLRIRNATPDDAAFLAWLILTAGRAHVKRGMWEVVLNESEDDCLRFLRLLAVTDAPHLFHEATQDAPPCRRGGMRRGWQGGGETPS